MYPPGNMATADYTAAIDRRVFLETCRLMSSSDFAKVYFPVIIFRTTKCFVNDTYIDINCGHVRKHIHKHILSGSLSHTHTYYFPPFSCLFCRPLCAMALLTFVTWIFVTRYINLTCPRHTGETCRTTGAPVCCDAGSRSDTLFESEAHLYDPCTRCRLGAN